jgi:hypothetical protein
MILLISVAGITGVNHWCEMESLVLEEKIYS